jgi:hypothetical protein
MRDPARSPLLSPRPVEPAAERASGAAAGGRDPRLLPFLEAPDDDTARDLLGSLLAEEVAPLAWQVVRRQLGWRSGHRPTPEDLEDVHSGVLLRVSRHLLAMRSGGAGAEVTSLADYVAVTAFNACASFHEARFPLRTRLRYRLRYALSRDSGLALWEIAPREWRCGLPAHARASAVVEDPPALEEAALQAVRREGKGSRDLPRVLRTFFTRLGGPCALPALVEAMAVALQVQDPSPVGDASGDRGGALAELASPDPSSLERLEGRELFTRMWKEIAELPRPQRVALLLHLRDGSGRDLLGLLALAEVASIDEIARVLELQGEQLEALLPTLPRDDHSIAALLGVSQRQVINLRKSARARLGRRLRGVAGTGW